MNNKLASSEKYFFLKNNLFNGNRVNILDKRSKIMLVLLIYHYISNFLFPSFRFYYHKINWCQNRWSRWSMLSMWSMWSRWSRWSRLPIWSRRSGLPGWSGWSRWSGLPWRSSLSIYMVYMVLTIKLMRKLEMSYQHLPGKVVRQNSQDEV